MELIKEVTVKHFNRDILKRGMPIKLTFCPKSESEHVHIGFIVSVSGSHLFYATFGTNDSAKKHSIESHDVGRSVLMEVGEWKQ